MRRFTLPFSLICLVVMSISLSALTISPAGAEAPTWTDTLASRVAPENTYIYDSVSLPDLVFEVGESEGQGVVDIFSASSGNWNSFNESLGENTTAVTAIASVGSTQVVVGTQNNDDGAELLVSGGAPFLPFVGWEQDPSITEIQDIYIGDESACVSAIKSGQLAIFCTVGDSDWNEIASYDGLPRDILPFPESHGLIYAYGSMYTIGYDADSGHSAVYSYDVGDEDWTDQTSLQFGEEYVITSLANYQEAPVITAVDTTSGFNFTTVYSFGDGWGQLGGTDLGIDEVWSRGAKVMVVGTDLYVSARTQSGHAYLMKYDPEGNSLDVINPDGFMPDTPNQYASSVAMLNGQIYVAASQFSEGFINFGVYTDGDFVPPADLDGDGVDDSVEDSFGTGDSNDDGTPDSEQSNVATLENPVTGGWVSVVLESADGCTQLSDVTVEGEDDLDNPDPTFDYPSGVISYVAICDDPGDTATLTVFYSDVLDEVPLRKIFPDGSSALIDDATVGEVTFSDDTEHSVVTYSIADGGELDMDEALNSQIVDPVGLATAAVVTPTTAPTPSSSIVPAPSVGATGLLPTTGSNAGYAVAMAATLMLAGTALTCAKRRRQLLVKQQ